MVQLQNEIVAIETILLIQTKISALQRKTFAKTTLDYELT